MPRARHDDRIGFGGAGVEGKHPVAEKKRGLLAEREPRRDLSTSLGEGWRFQAAARRDSLWTNTVSLPPVSSSHSTTRDSGAARIISETTFVSTRIIRSGPARPAIYPARRRGPRRQAGGRARPAPSPSSGARRGEPLLPVLRAPPPRCCGRAPQRAHGEPGGSLPTGFRIVIAGIDIKSAALTSRSEAWQRTCQALHVIRKALAPDFAAVQGRLCSTGFDRFISRLPRRGSMRYRRASPNSLDRKPYLGGCHDSPEPGRRLRRGGMEPQRGSLDAGRSRRVRPVSAELYTLPAFLRFMPPIDEKRVIDLGCGEGSNTRRFARLGGRMVGVDLSGELIARARQKEAEDPLGVDYRVGSFGDLACFAERAVRLRPLHHGADGRPRFRRRHAGPPIAFSKPGGTLCFSVLHPCFVTPAIRWVRDEQGAHLGLQVGRYFDQDPLRRALAVPASAPTRSWSSPSKCRASRAPCPTTSTR